MPAEPAKPLFLSADRVDALAAWCCSKPDVLTLHLPVDEAGAYPAALERLVRESIESDPSLKRLAADIERVCAFVRKEFVPAGRRGLSVYSEEKRGLFQAYAFPEPLRASLTAAEAPCLRPLELMAGRYHRYLVALADGLHSRFLEIYLGESIELGVSDGGVTAAAARAAELMRERRADRLIVGAAAGLQGPICAGLPAELQERVIQEPLLGPDRPIEAVVERVRHSEREALRLRETVLLQRVLDEQREGGAVSGLQAVAAALQQGCVKLLLVQQGWTKMGRVCPACGRLSVDHRSCPWCFRQTDSLLDLVSELVERAAAAGVAVFPVQDPRILTLGHIAAELAAANAPRRREVPASRALRARFRTKDGRASPLRSRP